MTWSSNQLVDHHSPSLPSCFLHITYISWPSAARCLAGSLWSDEECQHGESMSVPHRHKVPTHSRRVETGSPPLSTSQSLITRKCYQRKVTMSHTMGFLYCCNPLGRGERERGESWHVSFQKALLHTESSLYSASTIMLRCLQFCFHVLRQIKDSKTH